jgi:hypothetical protein
MTGNWFWWGSNIGQATYKQLYQLTVTGLKARGVHNVIYCWSPDKSADFSYYPGDDYVDILGTICFVLILCLYYSAFLSCFLFLFGITMDLFQFEVFLFITVALVFILRA